VRRFEEAAITRCYRTPEAAYTNAGVVFARAKRDDEARGNFGRALQVRPNFAEAAYQLTEPNSSMASSPRRAPASTPSSAGTMRLRTCCCSGCASRAQGDKIGAQRYARRLQVDFPGTDRHGPWRNSIATPLTLMASEVGGEQRCGTGARLRGAREKKGLTVLEAAENCTVDARTLEALEAEDFAALGADVYVRGHLRRYGRVHWRIARGAAGAVRGQRAGGAPGSHAHRAQ